MTASEASANPFSYKGYVGKADWDADARMFFGHVPGMTDVITFQGETIGDAAREFVLSVDDYLALCAERGEEPEKPKGVS